MDFTKNGYRKEYRSNGFHDRGDGLVDPLLADLTSECESLSASLVSPDALAVLLDQTRDEMFSDPRCRSIRESIEAVHNAGRNVDAVSVADDLRRRGILDDIGGEPFLIQLLDGVPRWWQAGSNAERIVECHRRRRVHQTATAMREAAESPVTDLSVLGEIESRLGIGNDKPSELFPVVTAKELFEGDYSLDYLIGGMLVRGQNCILAGPKKALKTNLAIALALRLGIGGYLFKGERWQRYHVAKPVRCCLMSGESGAATIKETAARIARSMGWGLDQVEDVLFCFSIPNLGDPEHLRAMERFVVENQIEVLFIDPAYLCLPLGDNAGNLFAVGQFLASLNRLAEKTGLTTVLIHHLKKTVFDPSNPPELEDIAWSGFQEFARQWILIGRRSPYDAERGGHHELWMNFGGSAGHSGLLALDIEEGTRQDEGGRIWSVETLTAEEARFRAAEQAEERKEQKRELQFDATRDANREKLLKAFAKYPDGETENVLRTAAKLSGKNAEPIIAELEQERLIEPCDVPKGKRKHPGYRLRRTVGQSESDNSLSGLSGSRTDNSLPVRESCPCPSDRPIERFPMDLPEVDEAEYAGEVTHGDF